MQRELGSFPLPPAQRCKLSNAGFTTAQDVLEMKPSQLSQELSIPLTEALSILRVLRGEDGAADGPAPLARPPAAQSALAMLQDEACQQSVVTFSQELDSILGGGVPLTKITEICGAPGIGKTQMCLQLCAAVQIPEEFGGLSGEAVYIDTEGSFLVQRLVDIAKATVDHCREIAQDNQEQDTAMQNFSLESVLKGVHYFRCHDYVELIAIIHTLPEFLDTHPHVRLVVVDSIAFHFRHDFQDYSLRTRLLNGMAQQLNKLAYRHRLAMYLEHRLSALLQLHLHSRLNTGFIGLGKDNCKTGRETFKFGDLVVLTNQMTTKLSLNASGSASSLIPALGESWGHAATIRLILYWHYSQRWARLYKSPTHKEQAVPYQITTGGVRDLHQDLDLPDNEEDTQQPAKRMRLEQS